MSEMIFERQSDQMKLGKKYSWMNAIFQDEEVEKEEKKEILKMVMKELFDKSNVVKTDG